MNFTVEELLARTVPGGPDGSCREWTGSRGQGGYPQVSIEGRTRRATRVLMEAAGANIAGLYVCHRCDNPPCINPDHLFLGTHQDNTDDMMAKGRFSPTYGDLQPNAKLNPEAVRDIRTKRLPQAGFAALYGVNRSLISYVQRRLSWPHVPPAPTENQGASRLRRLSPEEVEEIRASPLTGVALARKLGVNPNTISSVRTGKTWSALTAYEENTSSKDLTTGEDDA